MAAVIIQVFTKPKLPILKKDSSSLFFLLKLMAQLGLPVFWLSFFNGVFIFCIWWNIFWKKIFHTIAFQFGEQALGSNVVWVGFIKFKWCFLFAFKARAAKMWVVIATTSSHLALHLKVKLDFFFHKGLWLY